MAESDTHLNRVDVTVVLPVRNGELYIEQAITSALEQNGVSIEVIVLDDASTDATVAIAGNLDERVQVVRLEKQPTHIRSTNRGIELAKGEFISILHHDDYYVAGKLAEHVALHRRHPMVGLSYSRQLYVGPDGRRLWSLRSPVAKHDYVVDGVTEMQHLVVQNYLNFVNAFVPAAVYRSVGRFNEDLWVSAEWDMWLRIARSWKVGYIDRPLACYRLHPGSLTHAGTTNTSGYYAQLRAVVDDLARDTTLPRVVRSQLPLTVANMHVSMAVLRAMRGQWPGAAGSALRAAISVAPWRWPRLIRSAALIPRVGARLQLARDLRRSR